MAQSSLQTSSARLAAVRLKSANTYIFRALLSIASAALLSRLMGMVNQVIVTSRFGAGATMDAYFIASTAPTLLAYLLISTIETAVTPVYARIRTQEKRESASRLFSTLLNLLIIGTVLLTTVLFLFQKQVLLFSAPALDASRFRVALSLTTFTYPVIIPMVIIGFLECILNTEGQFGWPAYAGLLVPLTAGVLVLVIGKSQGVVVYCVGTILGLCLQCCAFVVRARKAKIVYRPILDLRHPALHAIVMTAWPVLLGSLISQVSPLVDQIFASFLPVGSISALSYSLKLVSVCSGVIFASVGRAALPYLSRQAAQRDMHAFKGTLRLYLWLVGLGTILLSVGMIVLARPLVQMLFQRGAFSAADTDRTATILVGFVVGLAPMSLGIITSKAFSALGKTKVLMGVSLFSVVANVVLDALFSYFWQGFGIALATSVYYVGTMLLLFFMLRRMIGRLDLFTVPQEIVEGATKVRRSSISLVWGTWQQRWLAHWGGYGGSRQVIFRGALAVAVFLIGTFGVLQNALYTLRVSFGSIAMLLLLRYRYSLLVVWIGVSAILSPNLPFLTNNNFFTGLTIPTLLLLLHIPPQPLFKRMPTLVFLLLYLLWVLAGMSISDVSAGQFLTVWLSYVNYLALALLTLHVLLTWQGLLRLIDVMLLGATFVALYGIEGFVTQQNGVLDPTTSLFRIFSIFSAAPPLALFLSVVIPLGIYRASTVHGWQRMAVWFLVLVLLLTLGLTFTRGAFVSIPVSLLIMLLFHPSRKKKLFILGSASVLGIAGTLLAVEANIPIFGRFLSEDVSSLNGRTYLWQALLDHFDPTHLLGYGLKASDTLLNTLQVGFDGSVIATSPSNLFLGTLYDHGVIGLLLLLLVFTVLTVNVLRGIHTSTGERRALFVVALAIFVNVFIQSFEVNDIWTQAIGLYFWIAMTLPFARCRFAGEPEMMMERTLICEEDIPARDKMDYQEREPVSLLRFPQEGSVW